MDSLRKVLSGEERGEESGLISNVSKYFQEVCLISFLISKMNV